MERLWKLLTGLSLGMAFTLYTVHRYDWTSAFICGTVIAYMNWRELI